MRLIRTGVGACVAVTVLAGCGGGGDEGSGDAAGGEVVDGGTFTMAMDADPGSLDPQMSASSNVLQLSRFAYDPLLHMDDEGQLISGLASDWQVDGQEVTLTIADGVTCADGEPFTAADAADNIDYVADPANESPLLGTFLPPGASATADGSTLTLTLESPAPFVLEGLTSLPMVCASGLADRSVLASESRGTGPFELTEVVPTDHVTFTLREGYTWGPDGAGTDEQGMPDEVVVQVVPNETTSSNLLLSGGLNAATVLGPDAQRLSGAGLFSTTLDAVLGEMWFNHAAGRPGADPAVRTALTQALDLGELQEVLTGGTGSPGSTFATAAPVACPGDSVSGELPTGGLEAAAETLDAAGWTAGPDSTRAKDGTPLELTFIYNSGLGTGGSAAAELAASTWQELGAEVEMSGQDDTALLETVFGSGNWDVTWLALNVSSPDQLVPFMSGPTAPEGNNFAAIDNADYAAGVAEAMTMTGTEGCDTWLAAESALVRDADVVPFANQSVSTFGSGARFESGAVAVVPTSIRMTAG
ncbi:ABC transporter substrate-binding protein [Modestobacter marinus]|uniref:Peptide ABC transporter substrate-binding protein n=1 Tax=Modestobacter marinus TaxID=477641 RepID=A0A846LNT4_9ACTN|nr:ABC transporter substrate-binding protein [Modestobacter marinus]NIH68144.1 peptide/nickel transport system substrate-binding protein [Modestobacter marinus]GGL79983.1 peptide ABC transporter substrate-binding protein [Modestobacter marinus]